MRLRLLHSASGPTIVDLLGSKPPAPTAKPLENVRAVDREHSHLGNLDGQHSGGELVLGSVASQQPLAYGNRQTNS